MKNKFEEKTSVHQPHDKFFRTVMADKRVARDFLTVHLPPDILKVIDLENIELQPRSYINDIRKESVVDVLFKTTINGKEAYLYLLVEHQSEPDKLMPFRLLKYIINIINDYLDKTGKKSFPLIYPMVVYHADKPYPYSTDIRDLVDAPREFIDRYFLQPFHLIDLGKINDEEIKSHAWAGIMEFALKHVFARDVLLCVKEIAAVMRRITQEGGEKYIEIVLEYLMGSGEVSSENEFINLINKEISKNIGGKIMSLAERIKAEGRQEGRQEETQRIALKLIMQGETFESVSKLTDLSPNELQKLKEEASH